MKKFLSLFTVFVMVFSIAATALADDVATIPADKKSHKGSDMLKTDKASEPIFELIALSSGSSIKFWIWRDSAAAQVTTTYEFNTMGLQDVKYNNSGNKGKNEYYHPVFKKTTQPDSLEIYINYAFIP